MQQQFFAQKENLEDLIQFQIPDYISLNIKSIQTKSLVVGGGFSFDITEFFKFPQIKNKKIIDQMTQQSIPFYKKISSRIAWLILIYSVCNNAMIPPWIMSIKADKNLRIAWRFFMQSLILIPFSLYEKRISRQEQKYKFTLKHIFKSKHLKLLYLSSFATCLWFTFVLYTFQWTFISHSFILGSLSNFFLSITRKIKGEKNHQLQSGGQALVILGISMLVTDSILFQPENVPKYYYNVITIAYLKRQWYQRVWGDMVAFSAAYLNSYFSTKTLELKQFIPSYLSMTIVSFINYFNMLLSSYFFTGSSFSWNIQYGFFGLFSNQHFASFMYMSLILGLGLLISYMLISNLFQKMIPAITVVFEPAISSILLQVVGVQYLPPSISCMSFIFIMPGLFLIIIGQHLLRQQSIKK